VQFASFFFIFHFSFILICKQRKLSLRLDKLGLGANVETGLGDQCENQAWGLVWKPGLRASVGTGLGVYWSFI